MEHTELPILNALKNYITDEVIRFHMPGHKGKAELGHSLKSLLGENIFKADVTNIPEMDDLHQPHGILKEAQALAAEAFGSDHTYFLINGSSCGLQALVMTVANPGEKILVPRNIHRSILTGIILSGAVPVFYLPEYCPEFAIPAGVNPATIKNTLEQYPTAKAVLIVNPTYHGISSDLGAIAEITHKNNIPLLVDEAHGPHFCFHECLPPSALALGADAVVHGTHKMLTSLTQSAMVHIKGNIISKVRLESTLRLLQSTSTSYILLSSLDCAREHAQKYGKILIDTALEDCHIFRSKLKNMLPIEILDPSETGRYCITGLDLTKITISFKNLGVSGFWVEKRLRDKYNIQVEMSDLYNILILVTPGNSAIQLDKLTAALTEIIHEIKASPFNEQAYARTIKSNIIPTIPELTLTPREAFFSTIRSIPLETADGEICAEIVSCYPPGIPSLIPGEKITKDIIEHLQALRDLGVHFQGCFDPNLQYINVLNV